MILVDILWKAVWLVCTIAAFVLVATWFGSQFRDLSWEDTGNHAMNMLVAAAAAREYWQALKWQAALAGLFTTCASAVVWFLLEALVRSRFLSSGDLSRFMIGRMIKMAVLITAALILFILWLNGARLIAASVFLLLAFCLTLIETLIRADAVELLGTDLIRVTGLIGILLSLEMMIAASFGVILFAGFLNVARLGDALVMLGMTGITAVFLCVVHSYLLLVRFSAVDIMRQDVVAV